MLCIIIIINILNTDSIKRMIKALDLEKGQQQIQDIKQDNENSLYQGIQLINQQKWQEANENITQFIKLSEKQQSLATFFKCICLIEMNYPGQGIIMRQQAKKMNNNLQRDLLNYADEELIKIPQNSFMLIAKSYALNEEKKFKEAIQLCQQVLREEPQHLHALYRKCCSLYDLTQYSQLQNIIHSTVLVMVQKVMPYIVVITIMMQLFPMIKQSKLILIMQMQYMSKGVVLENLKKYNDTIACYDKAIQINPESTSTYYNKGDLLKNAKKYSSAIENYEHAIKYCKSDENEFKCLIKEIKNEYFHISQIQS